MPRSGDPPDSSSKQRFTKNTGFSRKQMEGKSPTPTPPPKSTSRNNFFKLLLDLSPPLSELPGGRRTLFEPTRRDIQQLEHHFSDL